MNREDRALDSCPVLRELPICDPNDDEAASDELAITAAVRLERVSAAVMLITVHFDDESVADQEIDTTHARYDVLRAQGKPPSSQPKTHDRFPARFGASVAELQHPRRDVGPDQLGDADQPSMQRRIDCGNSVLERPAPRIDGQRRSHGIGGMRRCAGDGPPVDDDPIVASRIGETGSIPRHGDMDSFIRAAYPHPRGIEQ